MRKSTANVFRFFSWAVVCGGAWLAYEHLQAPLEYLARLPFQVFEIDVSLPTPGPVSDIFWLGVFLVVVGLKFAAVFSDEAALAAKE